MFGDGRSRVVISLQNCYVGSQRRRRERRERIVSSLRGGLIHSDHAKKRGQR
jgi:hypothetical protein